MKKKYTKYGKKIHELVLKEADKRAVNLLEKTNGYGHSRFKKTSEKYITNISIKTRNFNKVNITYPTKGVK
jgi:hypothetical protein